MPTCRVYFLPAHLSPESLGGRTAVVIDLLRATTTICHALAAGAAEVRPCLEIDEALALAERLSRSRCLLGGERGGRRIDGFELGNSPLEYQSGKFAGATLVFTTTNGTRAIERCRSAAGIYIGALVNLSALCERVANEGRSVDIVCAGTEGAITYEDILAAGAIADRLGVAGEGMSDVAAARSESTWTAGNDEALVARDAWRCVAGATHPQDALLAALRQSRGGRNLLDLGYDADIVAAAAMDRLRVVPCVSVVDGELRIADASASSMLD